MSQATEIQEVQTKDDSGIQALLAMTLVEVSNLDNKDLRRAFHLFQRCIQKSSLD
jgi:hypothetical protein